LGRPEGKINPEFSLSQVVGEANKLLGVEIKFVSDCVGSEVSEAMSELLEGEVLLLENVRFHLGDEENNEDFSKQLSQDFDIFVNDAFSASHRDHASVTGVANIIPSYAGFQLQKEVEEMEKVKNDFSRPAVAIIGGAKIETKLPVIKFFENAYDHVLVGGKIANEAIDQKMEFSDKVILPKDFSGDRFDIGAETIEKFREIIKTAEIIVWNGPLGKFEEAEYARGTDKVFEAVIDSAAYVVIGGGETLETIEKHGAMEEIEKRGFVSTGGGAMLEYLGGGKMPGIEALK
jgi:phosphoglycerate kinase